MANKETKYHDELEDTVDSTIESTYYDAIHDTTSEGNLTLFDAKFVKTHREKVLAISWAWIFHETFRAFNIIEYLTTANRLQTLEMEIRLPPPVARPVLYSPSAD